MLELHSLFDVSGKNVLVTGGSRGIGKMIAHGFVVNDANVYITSRKAAACDETAKQLSEYGNCYALPFDLSSLEGIEQLVSALQGKISQLDVLINNAGAAWGAPLEDYPESGWDKVMDLNLKSVFFLTQRLLPLIKAGASRDNPARVINIASIDGITNPQSENYAYSASKAGLIHLTKHMASKLAGDAVNVNAVAPGFFMTDMMSHVDEAELIENIPCGRSGNAADAAGVTMFLASNASAWVTGATIAVDGGMIANA